MDSAVDRAVKELGPLAGMVVSAGVFEGMPIEEMTTEFWDRVMAINVRGTFLAVRAAAHHMRSPGATGGWKHRYLHLDCRPARVGGLLGLCNF